MCTHAARTLPMPSSVGLLHHRWALPANGKSGAPRRKRAAQFLLGPSTATGSPRLPQPPGGVRSHLLALVGSVLTPLILGLARVATRRVFLRATTMTLTITLLLALASDTGTLAGAWKGPRFVLHDPHDCFPIATLCCMLLPTCILSGVGTLAERRLFPLTGPARPSSYRRTSSPAVTQSSTPDTPKMGASDPKTATPL